jgi:maltose-binding protein MalE
MKKAIALALVFVLALSLFTACESNDNGGSTGGNFKSTGSPDYNVAEKLTEIPSVYGIISALWCFEVPKYTIQVDISEDEAQKIAQIYLVAVKSGN